MNTTLQLLIGDDAEFARGLVELGWFDFAPTIINEPFVGKARQSLNPRFSSAGEVAGAGAWVYRLSLESHRWQDAVKVVESQINRRPHFAVVFFRLPRALMIVVPEDPDRARSQKQGIKSAQIFLDTTRVDNHVEEVIKRLKAAKRDGFRKRLQDSADVKRVTEGFYKDFKKQKERFASLIQRIGSEANQHWYASVLLNRLMFIYFIQSNGLLEQAYLRKKLNVHSGKGAGYYNDLLCPLFFQGLAVEQNKRSKDTQALLGDVPYLNGGLFMRHKLEGDHPDIGVPDEAFFGLFKLFDEYTWYIDDRPIARDREINPDVLGFIFEKYVNQKQMGAYYTKEDITGYICRNTIIPRLFDMLAEARGLPKFRLPIEKIEPYIWEAVKHGVDEPLPDYIEAGKNDVSYRTRWNESAPASHALPTETWRELIARRNRHAGILNDFLDGKMSTANDFITYNLDLPRAALDFVATCKDASILSDFYFGCLQRITVLDPTCGSGAFLFAALNILYPLYEACLDRMEELKSADRVSEPAPPLLTMGGEFAFANEVDIQQSFLDTEVEIDPYTVTTSILDRCRAELMRIAEHSNRAYYIHKTIIVNNLYGVDIMEEAIEICKLRLFLNLISHADPDSSKDNLGIEPLPDIDFNILAGNTLVGYVNKQSRDAHWSRAGFDFDADLDMDTHIRIYSEMLGDFRNIQLQQPALRNVTKADLVRAAGLIRDGENPDAPNNRSLNSDIWKLYKSAETARYKGTRTTFLSSHQPLHWFVEFPPVMASGGFDVIVGNPPYVEYTKVQSKYRVLNYKTEVCADLYAFVMERSIELLKFSGRLGVITPLAAISVRKTSPLRELIRKQLGTCWSSNFGFRPSKLFDGVNLRLTITLASKQATFAYYSSRYALWNHEERQHLFDCVGYISTETTGSNAFPKTDDSDGATVLAKLGHQRE